MLSSSLVTANVLILCIILLLCTSRNSEQYDNWSWFKQLFKSRKNEEEDKGKKEQSKKNIGRACRKNDECKSNTCFGNYVCIPGSGSYLPDGTVIERNDTTPVTCHTKETSGPIGNDNGCPACKNGAMTTIRGKPVCTHLVSCYIPFFDSHIGPVVMPKERCYEQKGKPNYGYGDNCQTISVIQAGTNTPSSKQICSPYNQLSKK